MNKNRNITRAFLLCFIFIMIFSNHIVHASSVTNDSNKLDLDTTFLDDRIQTLYNDSNSIIANEANSILQTKDGYIWIGAYSGLLRFDGREFTKIDDVTFRGFESRNIRIMYEASDGTLYIGSNDTGLYSIKGDVFTSYLTAPGLSNSVRRIIESSNGEIYVATTDGIGVIKGDKLNTFFESSSSEDNFIIDMIISGEKIWAVTNNGNLIVVNVNELDQSAETKNIGDRLAKAIYCDKYGKIHVGTFTGEVLTFDSQKEDSFSSTYAAGVGPINSMMRDSLDNLWVLGENGYGIFKDTKQFELISNSKITTFFESIMEDYEGNYWLTSSKEGVLEISKSEFVSLSSISDLKDTFINSTLFWNGNLYVATDNGLTIVGEKGQIKNELTNAMSGVRIRALQKDSSNNLWISTYNSGNGVIRYSTEGVLTQWNADDGMTNDRVRTVLEASNGRYYVATTEGINVLYQDAIEKQYTTKEGLENPYILCMAEGEANTIYAGSDGNGIYQITESGIENFSEKDGLSSGVILRMTYDSTNKALFISSSGKLNIWKKGGRIEEYENYSFDGNIFDIQIRGDKLILLSSAGMYITSVSSVLSNAVPNVEFYNKEDGLLSAPSANSWNDITEDGDLFISTASGVYIYNMNKKLDQSVPPKIALNKLIMDGVSYEPNDEISIPANCDRITITMSVLSYLNSSKNTIKYQLIGFDKGTILGEVSTSNTVTYTNLRGGDYKFVFSGINSDGVESDAKVQIKFIKERSLFEKPLTYILVILFVIGLTLIFARLYGVKKERHLKEQNKKYKDITLEAIEVISRAIDAKDEYTAGHSTRVAKYSVLIAKELGFSEEKLNVLHYTGLLHDIGKIGVPDKILGKPGKLTEEEFDLMKKHVEAGFEILKDITLIENIEFGALYHHERWDGKGYVNHLLGEETPLNARIIGIADAFDAMSSDRSYRKKLPREVIISELANNKGTQFDPELTEVLLRLIEKGIFDI